MTTSGWWKWAGKISCVVLPLLSMTFFWGDRISTSRRNALRVIGQVERIRAAESCFSEKFHRFGGLADLGPAASGLIDRELATGRSGGYRYQMSATSSGFRLWAWPEVYRKTGDKSLYLDETGVLRESWVEERASASSQILGPMPEIKGCQPR